MSTKTNDPKQTAPETDPTAEDVKTGPAAPAAEAEEVPVNKADKKEAKKEKEPKEKKETKKEIEADLAAEKDKYLRLLAEYDNYRRRSTREREAIYARRPLRHAQKVPTGVRQSVPRPGADPGR